MAEPRTKILWLEEVDAQDVDTVGSLGARLGELVQAGLPVPAGFVVPTAAFRHFLIQTKLHRFIDSTLADLQPADTKDLQARAGQIQEKIQAATMPSDLEAVFAEAYRQLVLRPSGGMEVVIRPSFCGEDQAFAKAPGECRTFFGVRGASEVGRTIQRVWASLFHPSALYRRAITSQDYRQVEVAVSVQAMIQAEVAGTLTTLDPRTNDQSVVVIEAAYGLGDALATTALTSDRYVVNKSDQAILAKDVVAQPWKIVYDSTQRATSHVRVRADLQRCQKLTDEQIATLAALAREIEEHSQVPQEAEWVARQGHFFFVQSRPVTRVTTQVAVRDGSGREINRAARKARPLLEGMPASLGVATGPVRMLRSVRELDSVELGDIVVTELVSAECLPALKRAAAFVADAGGQASHPAIACRELGIPAVVGTGTATHLLRNGQIVTVDGTNGEIYLGTLQFTPKEVASASRQRGTTRTAGKTRFRTATNIFVNLAEPSRAAEVATLPVDGVGLLRAEFMIAALGEHPAAMVKRGARAEYVGKLADGIEAFTRAFHPHPVVYRGSDFKTNEYRSLKGGEEFEPHEENPMLGYRGALRYLTEPDLFHAELEAIREVRGRRGYDNLWLMIPFVRTVDELEKVREMVEAAGLLAESTFKLWMMVEVPSNVVLIDQFLDVGIDGVSIGTNDLTQLTLGTDRDNAKLEAVFDERNPAVVQSVRRVIEACRAKHKTVSICGQAPSVYPEFAEMAIKAGVTSLSVNPDAIEQTRQLAASIERQLEHR